MKVNELCGYVLVAIAMSMPAIAQYCNHYGGEAIRAADIADTRYEKVTVDGQRVGRSVETGNTYNVIVMLTATLWFFGCTVGGISLIANGRRRP